MKSPSSISTNSTSKQDCGACTVGNASKSSSTLKFKNKCNNAKLSSKVHPPLNNKDSIHNDEEEEVGVQIKSPTTTKKSTTKRKCLTRTLSHKKNNAPAKKTEPKRHKKDAPIMSTCRRT